jgi:hypothetical protein
MTICRPRRDVIAEKQAKKQATDEDDDSEEDDDTDNETSNAYGSGNCMCRKSPQDFPDWKWLITRKGYQMIIDLQIAAEKRDQDHMGEYHYNDFSGYGFQEVVENHVSFATRADARGSLT